jgi:hypothetical protein
MAIIITIIMLITLTTIVTFREEQQTKYSF